MSFSFMEAFHCNASLKFIIKAAEPSNMHESIGPLLSIHNDMDDCTFSLASKAFVQGNELDWWKYIIAIHAVVSMMAGQGLEGRWAEVDGFIRDGTVVIGKACIDKGDLTGLHPNDVCTMKYPESVSVSR